jgi:hypothetical protein
MSEEAKVSDIQLGLQRLLTGLFSPATAARMEADSRMWMMQCQKCGYERSIWEIGGIRYKAIGNPRTLKRCPNCGKINWHKIYRREGPAPEVPFVPDSKRSPRWLMWATFLGIVAAFFVVLALIVTAVIWFTFYVVTG